MDQGMNQGQGMDQGQVQGKDKGQGKVAHTVGTMEEDNLMMHWKEIVVVFGAHMIEFSWDIFPERRIQTILEAMEVSGSRMRAKERETAAMKQDIQLDEDPKFSMKYQDYKHAEEPAQENKNYSKYQMVFGFELYLEVDSIPYLIP